MAWLAKILLAPLENPPPVPQRQPHDTSLHRVNGERLTRSEGASPHLSTEARNAIKIAEHAKVHIFGRNPDSAAELDAVLRETPNVKAVVQRMKEMRERYLAIRKAKKAVSPVLPKPKIARRSKPVPPKQAVAAPPAKPPSPRVQAIVSKSTARAATDTPAFSICNKEKKVEEVNRNVRPPLEILPRMQRKAERWLFTPSGDQYRRTYQHMAFMHGEVPLEPEPCTVDPRAAATLKRGLVKYLETILNGLARQAHHRTRKPAFPTADLSYLPLELVPVVEESRTPETSDRDNRICISLCDVEFAIELNDFPPGPYVEWQAKEHPAVTS